MAYPDYFSKFPNIDYPIRMNRAGVTENITIKDYFHLLMVKDKLLPQETLYEPYMVKNGERPDQVSYGFYGDEQYYWIILQINDIVDVYNDWPLSSHELDNYVLKKYGSHEAANEYHHYETREIYDTQGNLIVPGRGAPNRESGGLAQQGLIVPPSYSVEVQTYPGSGVYQTYTGDTGPLASCIGITNRQYEYDINEDKSQIWVLQEKYLEDYKSEVSRYAAEISDLDTELTLSDL